MKRVENYFPEESLTQIPASPCREKAKSKEGASPQSAQGAVLQGRVENTGRRDEKIRRERFCVGSHGRKAAAKGFKHSHQ